MMDNITAFLLGIVFTIVLLSLIVYISITIHDKKHPDKSEEELDAEFYKLIRDNQDFYWNDGFDRGYERAMEDYYGHHVEFLTDEEKREIENRLNNSFMSKDELVRIFRGTEDDKNNN